MNLKYDLLLLYALATACSSPTLLNYQNITELETNIQYQEHNNNPLQILSYLPELFLAAVFHYSNKNPNLQLISQNLCH